MSGSGSRYETITPENRGAQLWIITILCVLFTTTALAARVLSKRQFQSRYGADDFIALGGFILIIVQSGLMMAALTHGLGEDADLVAGKDVAPMIWLFWAAQMLLYAALYTIKVSMVFWIAKVFTRPFYAYWIAFILFGVASVVAVSAGCNSFECANLDPVKLTFDILTEIVLILLPLSHLYFVQMSSERKFKVTMSFGSRIGIIAFSCLTIWALYRILHNNVSALRHPTTTIVLPSIFQQVQLTLSFAISSLLPCIRYLFQSSEIERVPDYSLDSSQASVPQAGRLMGRVECGGWGEKNHIPSGSDDDLRPLGEQRQLNLSMGPNNQQPPCAA